MSNRSSLVLHRFIKSILVAGSLAASASAFASCGEPGRPPCELDPVYSRAQAIDYSIGGMSDEYGDWLIDEEANQAGNNGNSAAQTAPLSDYSYPIPRDFDGCGVFTVDVDDTVGGGSVSFRLCPEGDQLVVRDCSDNPQTGNPVQQCV